MLHITRRGLLAGGLAVPLVSVSHGAEPSAVPIADMHAHLFFVGPNPASRAPLGPAMTRAGATLVSWSLVGDMPWIRPTSNGLRQHGAPQPRAASEWLDEELARVKAHLTVQGLKLATAPEHIDRALAGDPHVVLSVEGASFLDDGLDGLEKAHAAGIRHVQLVHFIRNSIGDFQTEKPQHGGLTEFGKQVIAACNRLGILVDLAHATPETARQAVAVSAAPVVWSHSSISERPGNWRMAPWQARQLDLETGKAIAAKGGVIGLWGLRSDVGPTVDSYTDRLLQMADWLGDEHVAFGSDINAIQNSPIMALWDLRRVVDTMQKRGVEPARVRRIAIENYGRVLRQAMHAAPT